MRRFLIGLGAVAMGLSMASPAAAQSFPVYLTLEFCWFGVFDVQNIGNNCSPPFNPPNSGIQQVRIESDLRADFCDDYYAPAMNLVPIQWDGSKKIMTMDFNALGVDVVYIGKKKVQGFGGVMTDTAGLADPLNDYDGAWDGILDDGSAWAACCAAAGC